MVVRIHVTTSPVVVSLAGRTTISSLFDDFSFRPTTVTTASENLNITLAYLSCIRSHNLIYIHLQVIWLFSGCIYSLPVPDFEQPKFWRPKHWRHAKQKVAEDQHQDEVIGGGVKASQISQLVRYGWCKGASACSTWIVGIIFFHLGESLNMHELVVWMVYANVTFYNMLLYSFVYLDTVWMVPLTVAKPWLCGGTCLRSLELLSVMRGPNLLY